MSFKVPARLLAALSLAAVSTVNATNYDAYVGLPGHTESYQATSMEFEFPTAIKTRQNPVEVPHARIAGSNEIHLFTGEQQVIQSLYQRLRNDFQLEAEHTFINCHGADGKCGFYTPREFVRHPARHELYSRHVDIFNLNRHDYRMLAGKIPSEKGDKFIFLIHRQPDSLNNNAWLVLDITHTNDGGHGVESGYRKIVKPEAAEVLRLYFAPNSVEITAEAADTAKLMAEYINSNPELQHVLVGHTDDSGGDSVNAALAKQRAEAVYKLLTQKMAVPKARLVVDAKGSKSPISSNDNEQGRSLNRRVELIASEKLDQATVANEVGQDG